MSRKSVDTLFINSEDIQNLHLTNEEILGAIEQNLRDQGNGKTVIEPRTMLVPDCESQDNPNGHFNILRGYVEPLEAAGVKIVGDFYYNYKLGYPSEFCMLNLLNPKNGIPLALIDATDITAMRTGALTAIGAKYLAKKDSKILGHLGARGSSWWNVVLLDSIFDFDEIRVNSRRPESRNDFAERLSKKLNKPVRVCENSQECLEGADILVEATRLLAPEPLLKTEWVRPGSLVIPYGTISAVELDLPDVADKFLVDDYKQCFEFTKKGAFRQHVDSGRLKREDVYAELGEVVAGKKPGRETDDETIILWHRGLSINDVALGHLIYKKALEKGIGTKLRYWTEHED